MFTQQSLQYPKCTKGWNKNQRLYIVFMGLCNWIHNGLINRRSKHCNCQDNTCASFTGHYRTDPNYVPMGLTNLWLTNNESKRFFRKEKRIYIKLNEKKDIN